MGYDEVFKAVPSVVQAISVAVTAFFAVKSLRAWRVQLVGKRHFEAAEQVIGAVYDVREALSYMRRSYYLTEDTRDRPRPDAESELDARQRDACFIIEHRFNEASEKFSALRTARLLCTIHFTTAAVTGIDEIFNVRNKIYVMLGLANSYVGKPLHSAEADRMLSAIWARDDETDEMSKQIASAVAKIEEVCAPYLK